MYSCDDATCESSRAVRFKRHSGDGGPGFSVVGGNTVGIFVHEIYAASACKLHHGDMILEVP